MQELAPLARLHKGVRVPWVALWSSERHEQDEDRLTLLPKGPRIGYADEIPSDRDTMGVLWVREGMSPGNGEPIFGEVNGVRQRACFLHPRCQVCGLKMSVRTFVLGKEVGDLSKYRGGRPFTTGTPPVCIDCRDYSLTVCPHLRTLEERAWITATKMGIWGYFGDVVRLEDGEASLVKAQMIGMKDPRAPMLIAKQLIVGITEYTEEPL